MDKALIEKLAAEVVRYKRGKLPQLSTMKNPPRAKVVKGVTGGGRAPRVGGSALARPSRDIKTSLPKKMNAKERASFLAGHARKSEFAKSPEAKLSRGARRSMANVVSKPKRLTLGQQVAKATKGMKTPEGVKGFGKAVGEELSGQGVKFLTGGAAGLAGAGAVKMLKDRIHKPTLKSKMIKGVKGMFGKGSAGRKALAFGAGAAAIGGGIDALSSTQEAVTTPVKKKLYFKKMMAENPKLSTEKPEDVQKVFNTLFRFNKSIASDPLVAGAFMRRAMQFKEEGIQPVDVKTLVDVAEKRQKSKGDSAMRKIFPTSAAELSGFSKG